VYRQPGVYTDSILKAAKPADLCSRPKTSSLSTCKPARALGIDVPPTLLAIADEVFK
jgi:putative tryptophan/tyrosine transport system substrate-binding protein